MYFPFRQVHLDFHTSEAIEGVGAGFNAEEFVAALQAGYVNSVTVFSKCHHGWSYHDTTVGARHPHLSVNLLEAQLAVCKNAGIRAPIYISAGWDEKARRENPGWLRRDKNGNIGSPLKAGWQSLCFNTPYLDYLCEQIKEVVAVFGANHGIFLDIIHAQACYCDYCRADMTAAGLDYLNEDHANAYAQTVLEKYYHRANAAVYSDGNTDRPVFHNSGHIPKGATNIIEANSHLELESLPTGGWGYDHFPVSAKYVATTGKEFLGMTGKFHTTWGEFGGFKRPEALRYECAAMLAFGAKCSVGDQLHPSGVMNPDTYRLIGAAYSEVAASEAWCDGVRAVSEIAILAPESLELIHTGHRGDMAAEEGAARMLLELGAQFDVVDTNHDLSAYTVVVLPDIVTFDDSVLTNRLAAFRQAGGKLLLSGASGMTADKTAFVAALNLPLKVVGKSAFDPDYLVATDALPDVPVRGAFVVHGGAWNVEAGADADTLAFRADPYFNRTAQHFCSHQHSPDAALSPYPGVVAGADFAYFAHNIFTRYRRYGQPLYRDTVEGALRRLLGGTFRVETSLPTAARTSLQHQPEQSRYVLHLLYATPQKRGAESFQWGSHDQGMEVIEDLVPLHDVSCAVRLGEPVNSVRLVPSGDVLAFTQSDGAVRFTVPRLLCHQMIELAV